MRISFSTVVFFLGCVLLFSPVENQAAQLKQALNRYKNVTVSNQALRRLAPYNSTIAYYAQFTFFQPKHKVHPDFIRALILAESDANPNAVSSKGAMGLGQIILSTGREAARELSRSPFTFRHISRNKLADLRKEDLFNPAVNILLTCYLISKYNYKYDGRLEMVISAWNAGENQEEVKKGRHAPYKETINLIGKVNGYYIDLIQRRNRLRPGKR